MPIGWIISLVVLAPNLLWMRFPPVEMPSPNASAKNWLTKVLEGVEGLGRIGVFAVPFFCRPELAGPLEKISAGLMLVALAIYYAGWWCYFGQGRAYRLLYQSLVGLPVPLAISPVVYFAAASIVLHSGLLAVVTVLFGAAHIALSWREAKRSATDPGRAGI